MSEELEVFVVSVVLLLNIDAAPLLLPPPLVAEMYELRASVRSEAPGQPHSYRRSASFV